MDKSPVIEADIGDGGARRLFLGRDELRLIEQECGAGFYSLYLSFSQGNVSLEQVGRVLRLALIGGGMDPKEAMGLVQYYAAPPRPLKTAYLIAHQVMEACWSGYPATKKEGPPPDPAGIDTLLRTVEANIARAGYSMDLSGLSLAEVAKLHNLVFGSEKPPAPDAETFHAIKQASRKAKK